MRKHFLSLLLSAFCLPVLLSCTGSDSNIDYAAGLHDIPDLSGKRVSTLLGALDEEVLSAVRPEADMVRLNSAAEVIAAVTTGQADYLLVDSTSLIDIDVAERRLKQVFVSRIVYGSYGFGFRHDDADLCNEFNAFLARYQADGRMQATSNRWTTGRVGEVVMQHQTLNPDAPVLRVGAFNFFPFCFVQNGRMAGYEAEILEAFAAETGRNIEYLSIDFSGLIAALVSGKIDIISGSMTITEERGRQVLFSSPYYSCGSVCLCRDTQSAVADKPFVQRLRDSIHANLIVESRWQLILQGLWETILISLCSILLGSLFGAFVCMMRMSHRRVLKGTARVYIEVMRGIPVLVLLMLMFYVIFAQSSVSPRWVAIIAFALNFGAYVSEMYRAGIEGVDRGQTEAGLAMGFSRLGTFVYFILPQAAKRVLPVFKGEAVSLFKNTSVVGYIAIQDLTKASDIIRARTFDAFFPLILISIIYFVLAWLFGKALDGISKRIA